ncbi:MAG: septum formation protein Maf [Clostridia bacterium]|nr:septum formation protein Maf [Clostridia bacterium]
MKVILASKSPRRRELLARIIPEFDIITAPTDETLPCGMHPREGVEVLAVRKGAAVMELASKDALIVSSDTLVEIDGTPLGKPEGREDAHRILSLLSGRVHNVHTGVAVHYGNRVFSGTHTSRVTFRKLTDEEIYSYIDTGEPMDKAGAYGIQGMGGSFVESFCGEFESIMGLSVTLTRALIDEALKEEGKDD